MLQNKAFHIFYCAPAIVFILGEIQLKNLYVDCVLPASYLMMLTTSKGLGTLLDKFGY